MQQQPNPIQNTTTEAQAKALREFAIFLKNENGRKAFNNLRKTYQHALSAFIKGDNAEGSNKNSIVGNLINNPDILKDIVNYVKNPDTTIEIPKLQALGIINLAIPDEIDSRKTPLMLAAELGNAEAVKALIEAGADPRITGSYRKSALHYAAESGNAEAVKALIAAGADPRIIDSSAKSALHYAAQSGNAEAVKALIAAGADLSIIDSSTKSALHYAAQSGNAEAVKALIEAGADPRITWFCLENPSSSCRRI